VNPFDFIPSNIYTLPSDTQDMHPIIIYDEVRSTGKPSSCAIGGNSLLLLPGSVTRPLIFSGFLVAS
jgi:hypothetical protein